MNTLSLVLAVTASACLAACTSNTSGQDAPSPSVTQPSSSPSSAAQSADWLDDLAAIDSAVRDSHADPFAVVPEEVWTQQVERLKKQFPSLTPEQRIVAMAGLAGLLDTHTQYFSEANERIFNAGLYRFPEGLFVGVADDDSLVGSRLVAVNGTPIKQIERKIRDLIPADNESALLNMAWVLGYPDYLQGLGVIDNNEQADFTVVEPDGTRRTVTVTSVDIGSFGEDHDIHGSLAGSTTEAVRRRSEALWSRVDKRNDAFLLTLNDYGYEGVDEALQSMAKALSSGVVDHVVIDMRYLRGGDPSPFMPIVTAVGPGGRLGEPAVTVLIGRENESAATVLAEIFDSQTSARLVGEPTPARADNFLCPCTDVSLPSSGYILSVPTTRAGNGDVRDAVVPDVVMRMKASDFFAGRDKVLQAALAGTLPD